MTTKTPKPPKPIEIFATGTHTSMQGQELSFAAPDLAATAAAYDPAKHEAPLVVGHPKADAPAYGWVQGLAVEDDRLVATPHQIDPAFAEMVAAGRFKKVSAQFWAPQSKGNPTPGVFALRHVGFLGAQPPAVKGLRSVEFAEGDDDLVTVTVDFAEPAGLSVAWALRAFKRVLSRMRDRAIETDGVEAGDSVVSVWELDDLERAADALAAEAPPSFSEPVPTAPSQETAAVPTDPDVAAREVALKAREDKLAADQAAFAEASAKAAATTFITDLVNQGKVLPVHQDRLVAFMASLDDAADTVSFAEGDKPVKASQAATFKDFLSGLPKVVEFGEVAPAGGPSFAAGDDDDAIAADAVAWQAEQAKNGRAVTTAQAVGHVTKQRKGA